MLQDMVHLRLLVNYHPVCSNTQSKRQFWLYSFDAAWNGHLDTVKVLLQNRAKPEEKSAKGEYTGFDALKFATILKNSEIERALIPFIQMYN